MSTMIEFVRWSTIHVEGDMRLRIMLVWIIMIVVLSTMLIACDPPDTDNTSSGSFATVVHLECVGDCEGFVE